MQKSIFSKVLTISLSILLAVGVVMGLPGGVVFADLSEVYPALVDGGNRLVDLQNNDGGWDWELDDGNPDSVSPLNTLAPITKGLAEVYLHTKHDTYLPTLESAGELLLSKNGTTDKFSPPDGYMAVQLDEIFEVTTYTDYVKEHFYNKLANGTYEKNSILYTTETYVDRIRNIRTGDYANLAAWDIGMGLVAASMIGSDTGPWIEGVKAEINELDGDNYFDVIGLAGALYGLAYVGEEFDPTSGEHEAASNLSDLAEILASYQLNSGGFTWNKNYLIEDEDNEAIQETAYAVLALGKVNSSLYLDTIQKAANYLLLVQLGTGGWESDSVYGENNEITAEALWAISVAYPVFPEVWVCESGDCGHPGVEFDNFADAIDSVMPGGLVHVLAGNYAESFSIYKSLDLLGEGADHSAVISGLINITADDVVIDGLTITNPGQPNAVVIDAESSDIEFTNNVFENIGGSTLTANVQAIYLQHGSDNVLIEGNTFQNISSGTKSVKPIFVGDSNTTDPSEGVVIRGNTFTNITSVSNGTYAILLNNRAGTTGLVIEDNNFSSLGGGGWTSVVGLEGPTPAAVVTENTFNDITSTGVAVGVHFEANPVGDTVTISYNEFNGSGYFGIAIHPSDQLLGYVVNGTFNWWGSDADPALDPAVGNVDTSPWLGFVPGTSPMTFHTNDSIQEAIDEAGAGDTIMAKSGTYVENVTIDKYIKLVGAGSGNDPLVDTIITTPTGFDTKVGVVQVTSSGLSQSEPILIQDVRLNPVGQAGISVGRFYESTGQTVSYLTFENVHVYGNNTNPSTEQERGLYVDNTSTLDYLTVSNSAFNNLTYGWYFQKAVSVDTSTVSHVTVTDTTFNHNNHKGIYAEKLSDASFDGIEVDQNGFSAVGMPSYFVPWMSGVDINLKAGTYQNISFTDSVFTNNGLGGAKEGVALTLKARNDDSYVTFPATLDHVLITNSTFVGNERGIRIGEPGKDNAGPTNVVINFNRIVGNEQAYEGSDGSAYGGLINQSLAAVDAENNWWGCNAGPGETGCDAVSGPGAVDADPWLVLTLTPDNAELEPGQVTDFEAGLYFNSDDVSTSSDGVLQDGILINFTASGGGTLDPVSGLTVDAVVETTFTPPALHNPYQVCAAADNEEVCTVVEVIGPGAVDDAYTTPEDVTLTVVAPGVLVNDAGVEAINHVVALMVEPEHGQVTLNADGSFTYVPEPGFVGEDSFEYQLVTYPPDAPKSGWADEAVVTITVTEVNDAPTAVADTYNGEQNVTLVISAVDGVLSNDSDPNGDTLTSALVSGPLHGTLTFNVDGSFTYVPEVNYIGQDSFTYVANDGELDSEPVTVTINLAPGIPVTSGYSLFLPFISNH